MRQSSTIISLPCSLSQYPVCGVSCLYPVKTSSQFLFSSVNLICSLSKGWNTVPLCISVVRDVNTSEVMCVDVKDG